MGYSMTPRERASIEAQVCLKAGTELAIAEIANGASGGAGLAVANAATFAEALNDLKDVILETDGESVTAPAPAQVTTTEADVKAVFTNAVTQPSTGARVSQYIADEDYTMVHKIFMAEKSAGVAYGSKDSAFMCNQAIRKLFNNGTRVFPADYWAEAYRGKEIPMTKNGKCGLGDFKLKKGLSIDSEGNPVLGSGEGSHPLANKSGYFGALVKHTPFNWGERPDAIDPQGWLVGIG
tara:strand:+ start:564 stop:1274 length:711 start_codon:yes stop_codon:yes gene_type:complete